MHHFKFHLTQFQFAFYWRSYRINNTVKRKACVCVLALECVWWLARVICLCVSYIYLLCIEIINVCSGSRKLTTINNRSRQTSNVHIKMQSVSCEEINWCCHVLLCRSSLVPWHPQTYFAAHMALAVSPRRHLHFKACIKFMFRFCQELLPTVFWNVVLSLLVPVDRVGVPCPLWAAKPACIGQLLSLTHTAPKYVWASGRWVTHLVHSERRRLVPGVCDMFVIGFFCWLR